MIIFAAVLNAFSAGLNIGTFLNQLEASEKPFKPCMYVGLGNLGCTILMITLL